MSWSFSVLVSCQSPYRGCVSPKQIENVIEQLGGHGQFDIDKDLDLLDGYEDLEPWAQEKIKYAVANGHVHDDDWKGVRNLTNFAGKLLTFLGT